MEHPAFLSLIVIVELYWSFSSWCRQPKKQILVSMQGLLWTRMFVLGSLDAIVWALEESGVRQVDFRHVQMAEHSRDYDGLHTAALEQKARARIFGVEIFA